MKSINKTMQDYFIKIAPDFSVFDMAEKYFWDNNLSQGIFKDVFYYQSFAGNTTGEISIYRGMFLVHSTGDLSMNINTDEYTVFPYYDGTQIVIAISDSELIINSTTQIELVIGVAF